MPHTGPDPEIIRSRKAAAEPPKRTREPLDLGMISPLSSFHNSRPSLRLCIGDVVDWWRVEAYEPECRLRLAAEMKLPGRAWLEFEVTPDGSGSTVRQTAIYDPVGLGGLAYWYSLYPVHQLIFAGMLHRIAEAAAGKTNKSAPPNE